MKRRWRIGQALASLGTFLFCVLAWAQVMERPELHEQDTWVYSLYEGGTLGTVGNYESVESFKVVEVSPKLGARYRISRSLSDKRSGETKENNYRISKDLNGYARQNATSPWQEVHWVQWPLEPGRSWRFERPLAAGIQVWEAKVSGWEDVEVPAGKFRTIRVEIDLVSNPNPLVTWQTRIWWSPEAKAFIRKTDHAVYEASVPFRRDTRELTSYQLH
ncbi:MAG TPA: hypothetical protein VFJ48_05490 [Casimicrobiaceae bacterium]|nr:hypothetical protein [Casimicrobiaceae bacterium]